MEALIMTAQMLLGISILVGLHEAGHMIAAKMFGMRVEKFSIGFPPKIFGFQVGETEYSLGAIPLGGFVKISGMIDESLDTEQIKKEPEEWEFRSKPAWQRLIVMLGGIIVNIITGVVIFIALAAINGETYTPISSVNQYGVYPSEIGKKLGFERGDKVVKVNGKEVKSFEEARNPASIFEGNANFTVLRDGVEKNITVTDEFISAFTTDKSAKNFIEPLAPFQITEVVGNSPAHKGGLRKEDKIVSINGQNTEYFPDFQAILQANKGKNIEMQVLRDGQPQTLTIMVSAEGTIGIAFNLKLEKEQRAYTLQESVEQGTKNAFNVIWVNMLAFGKMFQGKISPVDSLGGPIEIARKFYGGQWDWLKFWAITGMLSMVLAFMNVLPIPALDGGHVMFLCYEMVVGKAPSDKFLEYAQKAGMIILLSLMAFVFGKDIFMLIMEKL